MPLMSRKSSGITSGPCAREGSVSAGYRTAEAPSRRQPPHRARAASLLRGLEPRDPPAGNRAARGGQAMRACSHWHGGPTAMADAAASHTLSIGLPEPLKMRPSMSSDTGVVRISPENSTEVLVLSIPEVPSNTCTTAFVPATSSTWPERCEPSGSLKFTISANRGRRTLCARDRHRSQEGWSKRLRGSGRTPRMPKQTVYSSDPCAPSTGRKDGGTPPG